MQVFYLLKNGNKSSDLLMMRPNNKKNHDIKMQFLLMPLYSAPH